LPVEVASLPARVDDVTETTSPQLNGGGQSYGLDDHIYQRLLKERIVFLGSEVKDQNANAICAQMLLLNAEDPKRELRAFTLSLTSNAGGARGQGHGSFVRSVLEAVDRFPFLSTRVRVTV